MMFFDPVYFVFVGPALLLALWASFYTKSTFRKYSKSASSSGLTGAEAASRMLQAHGIGGVRIESVGGMLTDHYDPGTQTLRLSKGVYSSPSLAAVGIACHEAGHALQHAQSYTWLGLRTSLVPVTSVCSNLSYWFIIGGFFLRPLLLVGVVMFAIAVVFSIITLPVEWNASARAKRAMVQAGIVTPTELPHAKAVLNAAFLTYVAAAFTAVMQLLYYLLRTGVLGGGDD
ncbi:MAG: zinc metallopeptidase [Lentisphaeria bacterium]|nr:zinc metallopeptidase [Lentisphaeria bacterium]